MGIPQPPTRSMHHVRCIAHRFEADHKNTIYVFQGDLLDDEYRCLSSGFRQRNHLSQHAYRGYRGELLELHPRLRWALYRCRVEEITIDLDQRTALLRASVPTPPLVRDFSIVVALVREDFSEVTLPDPARTVEGGVPLEPRVLAFEAGPPPGHGPPEEFDLLDPAGQRLFEHVEGPDGGAGLALWGWVPLRRSLSPEELGGLDLRLGREWRIEDFWVE